MNKMLRLLRLAILIGVVLTLSACGDNASVIMQNKTTGQTFEIHKAKSMDINSEFVESESPINNSVVESYPRSIEVTLLIDGYRTTINAYESMWYSPFILIDDLKIELDARNIPFDTQEFASETPVRVWDIIPYLNFEMNVVSGITPSRDIITVYTEELIVGEHEQQLIIDFLAEKYPQIFKREIVFDYYGEGVGSWYIGDFMLFDIGGGVPGVSLKLMDAGSTGNVTYIYVDGEFQQVGIIHPYYLFYDNTGQVVVRFWDEEGVSCYYFVTFINGECQTTPAPDDLELTPVRSLDSLRNEIDNAINQKMWQTAAHPSGAIIDVQISDDIVDLILGYFEHNMAEIWGSQPLCYRIDEIRWSLINDNLIRVKTTISDEYENWYWLELNVDGDNIVNCINSWWY